MKAITQTGFGPPTRVLSFGEVDAPSPAAGQALVRVRAAGVARGDWLIASGQPYIARPSYGFRTPKQAIPGLEMAGVVESAGSDASRFDAGAEVFGWCNGAFAELVAVDEGQLVTKPPTVTFEQAASVPGSGFAALQAVRDQGEVTPGQRVLITGASGGVGSLAVQIAKAAGAEVTGVCSTRNVDMVRSLGADHVIDYTKEDIDDTDQRYDVIIDIAGNRSISAMRNSLVPDGTLVIVGGTGGKVTMGFGRTVRAMATSPFVGHQLRSLLSKPNLSDLETLAAMMESGELTPVVDATYPLAETARVIDQLGSGSSSGKRVIVP